jgi:hypothetical protein
MPVHLNVRVPLIRRATWHVELLLVLAMVIAPGCARREEKPANPSARGKVSAEIADQGPRLVGQPPTVQIELPPRMTTAIADVGPEGFATLSPFDFVKEIVPGDTTGGGWRYPYDGRQAPFALVADFDGDGRDDVALLQRSNEGGRVAVVLDPRPAPRVFILRAWTNAATGETAKTGFYLTRFPAGRFKVPDYGGSGDTSQVAELAHEGIQVSNYGKAATTYYWSDGQFRSVTTGD